MVSANETQVLLDRLFQSNTIQEASIQWTMPTRNWKEALNQFIIEFKDRLTDFIETESYTELSTSSFFQFLQNNCICLRLTKNVITE